MGSREVEKLDFYEEMSGVSPGDIIAVSDGKRKWLSKIVEVNSSNALITRPLTFREKASFYWGLFKRKIKRYYRRTRELIRTIVSGILRFK